ncbi:MAG TPA: hypothetical protein VGW40_01270 [Allosphingosinicella sp.]|nr:hypothetical protein [Allosphingosinicella sp.]
MRNGSIHAAMLLLLAAAPYPDRHRTVAGWRVEDVAEQDGGRLVSMRRDALGYHIQFHAAFWRGNDGRIQTTLVEHSDCTNGDELARRPAAAAEVRALLARHLADCAAAPGRIALLLRGFEPAWRLASAWAAEAEAATAAEAAAIAEHGRD